MFILSAKAYDLGKKLVQVILPAFTALYIGLAALWDLPEPEKVSGTIALVNTFLGVCLGISNTTYKRLNDPNAGKLVVSTNEEGRKLYSLEIEGDPEEIETKSSVTFHIQKNE